MSERPRSFRTPALILKRRNFGEADRQVTLLTPHFGKFDALAKGARKPTSKKTGHVELFMKSDLLIAKGRTLDIITQAEMLEPYLAIREDLERGAYASYAAELLDRFTFDSDDTNTRQLFTLLDQTFARLNDAEDSRLVIRYYELQLLDEVGFRPELSECVILRDEIEPVDQFFSFGDGGVVSLAGASHTAGLVNLPVTTLKLLRVLQRTPYEQLTNLTITEALQRDAERIMLGYLSYILESRVQSIDFIHRLRRMSS
ncbi:MAG: DNA repair protein RecO [Chloroflexota bacterium]